MIKSLAVRRWVAGVLALGIVVFGLIFIPRLAVDTDQLFFFKDDDPIRQDFARMEELFGGATPLWGSSCWIPAPASGSCRRSLGFPGRWRSCRACRGCSLRRTLSRELRLRRWWGS